MYFMTGKNVQTLGHVFNKMGKLLVLSRETNHASAVDNTQHIDSYTAEEISYQAMYGPFSEKPFPLHVSLLMVRDEQNTYKNALS